MYISRIPLNAARRGAAELMASPYKMHAAVEHAFPPALGEAPAASGAEGRILWRLDALPGNSASVWLYVVSPARPDFTHVCEQAGWPTTGTWETKDYAPVLERLAPGQQWAFRLKANPARKVACDRGREPHVDVVGTIQGHVTEDQQRAWLLSRCEGHGFRVACDADGTPLVRVSQRQKTTFAHRDGKVTLTTAVYDGLLVVTDARLFREVLCQGIGRAKGFGCGLLTIAPPAAGRP